ncbi:Negative regulator of mitotic exit [Mortierella antarctica]|nr:Negative regulator of mitotic exit [Mortierella antarctica]
MAGLFSKKSKKDKDEKAAAKNAAAMAAAGGQSNNVSNVASTAASTTSITSSNSNIPGGSINGNVNNNSNINSSSSKTPSGAHLRDNSSANNSIANSIANSTHLSSAVEYQLQHQPTLSNKSSLDSEKTRMFHQHQHLHNGPHQVAASATMHTSFANATGPWISAQVVSTNPFPRFSHTASYVHTGTDIYVFGGVVKGSAQKDMHVIDSQTLSCQTLPLSGSDSPPPLSGHTAVTLGQYIMYFGGKDVKNKCSDSLYVLHTVRKEWNKPTILGLLPAPRHSHSACVIGTTMYIFGGQFNSYYLNDIASFDMKSLNTASPKWTRLEPASDLPPARAGHCAAAHDGKIYIFGGADEQFFYNDIWCYDPLTNKWEAVPAFGVLPTSRQGHASTVVDDTMYIYGGMDHEDQLLGDLSAFKFNDRRWLTFPDTVDSASPRTEHSMCRVGEKIYILGGQLELNVDEDSASIYILDTTKIRYHEPSSMNSLRSAYESDGIQRLDTVQGLGPDDFSRPTPSPDMSADVRRGTAHHQQSSESHDSTPNSYSLHLNNRFADDAAVAGTSTQPRMSLDSTDATTVSRRRTTGKSPNNGSVMNNNNGDSRATQSVDETRRPNMLENEYTEHGIRGGSQQQQQQQQRLMQFGQNGAFAAGHQQLQQELNKGRSSIDSRHRGSFNPPPRASLERTSRSPQLQHHQQHPMDSSTPLSSAELPQPSSAVAASGSPGPQHYSSRDDEIKDLKQREQWLLAEVAMARKKMGSSTASTGASSALKEEMHGFEADRDSEKYRIVQALLSVKRELDQSKNSIVTQAQVASGKLREAERVRTAALQEAAYLKAKVSALQSGEVSALVSTETARARDLEKRLTVALAQVDRLQSQNTQHEQILDRERAARETAQDREREAALLAEELQLSHTRSLAELATLHERASRAEAGLRECEAKNAASEAGLSSYQQQSTALFSQISVLKTTVDHQKKSLEKAKLAYSVVNERAEHVDRMWTQSRQEIDHRQLEFASARADLERAQREAEHWKTKAQDTELLWQKAKSENEAMRALMEEDMNEATFSNNSGASSPSGTNSRKHDSIMAITSASRVAELEHELGTLRQLLRESQAAAAQANKDLGETMVRISQLEQTSMSARAELATVQRQLNMSEDKVAALEAELGSKEEALEEMAKEQENNEVQLGVLRGVMRENGLLADDLILEALSQGADGKVVTSPTTMTGLKTQVIEVEKRAEAAEQELQQVKVVKKQQEERIQQLEADYQTAVHYVQGSESMLQRLRDEAQAAKNERDTAQQSLQDLEVSHAKSSEAHVASAVAAAVGVATVQMEEEMADLHRQLHDAMGRTMELEQKVEEMTRQLQESETAADTTQAELKTLKSKHHEHKKQGALSTESYQAKVEELEALVEEAQTSLAELRLLLETSQYDLEQAHEQNKSTAQELENALAALRMTKEDAAAAAATAAAEKKTVEEGSAKSAEGVTEAEQRRIAAAAAHQEELELVIENAQKTIQSLEATNQGLEQQLRASENKISILLDNFHGPDSVRNSMASLNGGDDLILRLMEANQHQLPTAHTALGQQQQQQQGTSTAGRSHLTPMSHGSHLTDRSSADSLANELELLRSNWGRAHLNNDAAFRTDAAKAAEGASTAAGGAVPSAIAPSAGEKGTPESVTSPSSVIDPASIPIPTSAPSSAPSSATSTMTSAQKLEEYEKMIDDMAKTRRQYEE